MHNDCDFRKLNEYNFENISIIKDRFTKIGNVTITKTPAIRGENEHAAKKMGKVSEYILTGEEKTLHIVGDTIFYEEIEATLNKYKPDVIVVNCCEATIPLGRLLMNLDDVQSVCSLCPKATVIATHPNSVNHALVSSDDVRRFAVVNNLPHIIMPKNGDCIEQ